MKQYQSIHDFLMDESFYHYVISKDKEAIEKWEDYLATNPEQQQLFFSAKKELLDIQSALYLIHAEENYSRLIPDLDTNIKGIKQSNKWKYYVAACIAFIFITVSAVWFFQLRTTLSPALSYITKPSEKRSIELPDGTIAKLNADSKIDIMEGFGKTNRAIKLSGEVYLEVAKNKDLPFVLSTDALVVRVLGTTLNVRAYQNEEFATASLIEGSAEVVLKSSDISPIQLKPMDKVVASVEGKKIKLDNLPPDKEGLSDYKLEAMTKYDTDQRLAETSWTEQKLVFVNEPLHSIAKTLERWYDVKIEFEDQNIKDRKYTAAFDEREELQSVLESLRASLPFRYEKVGPRTISIKLTNQ